MKTVARLLITYFAGSRVMKYLTLTGLLLILASLYVVLYLPQTEHMLALAVPGVMLFYFGTTLMPLTLSRLAQSHAACILPGARIKLLISAILTVLLVALPAGLLTPLAFVAGMSADVGKLFEQPGLLEHTLWLALYTYTSACIAATWLYVFLWFVTNERNLTGVGKAVMILLGLILLGLMFGPTSRDRDLEPAAALRDNVQQLAVVALVFSAGFLGWPWFKRWRSGWSRSRAPARSSRALAGKEIDLLLGNANPWLSIVASLMPVPFLLLSGANDPVVLLFCLTIASTAAGATAGNAPARSRSLWLRGGWSRGELYSVTEKSAWRHNAYVLVALLLILLVVGTYKKMTPPAMVTGVALIALSATVSTYLGLLLTRGVRLTEASLAAAVMLTLMAISLLIGYHVIRWWLAAGLLTVLALLAVVLRQLARGRWARIDWSQCRNETQRVLRAG